MKGVLSVLVLCHGRSGARMVEVAMGEPDGDDLHTELPGGVHQPVDLAARIDEDAFHGLRRPDHGRILLQGRDRNDPDLELGLVCGRLCHVCYIVAPVANAKREAGAFPCLAPQLTLTRQS